MAEVLVISFFFRCTALSLVAVPAWAHRFRWTLPPGIAKAVVLRPISIGNSPGCDKHFLPAGASGN
jgi:hypothetical protein